MKLKKDLKKKKLILFLSIKWFINTLKEGFASSTPEKFLSFSEIAKEELKKLII